MKKNKMMRAASFLLVAVLLTTSVISGTFAKYVTTATGSDSARVAKWGVEITAKGAAENTLFEEKYAKTDNTYTLGANTVISDVDVVAPGTSGTMTGFTVTGTPEVAVKVTYDATLILDNWKVDGVDYCPLVFYVKDITGNTTPYEASTMAELKSELEAAIEANTTYYSPNTNMSGINDDITVSWEWPFSTTAENDVKDTKLGNLATAPTVQLNVTCTITQVD